MSMALSSKTVHHGRLDNTLNIQFLFGIKLCILVLKLWSCCSCEY